VGLVTPSVRLVAGTYIPYLDVPWGDLHRTQEAAGMVALIGGELPMLVVVVALVMQWARQDSALTRSGSGPREGAFDAEDDAYDGLLEERSEEHTSELQSRFDLVCRLLLEKKKTEA